MTWQKATKIFILITCVVWIIYDIFALVLGTHATISETIMTWSFLCPLAPAVWGGLAGHFFIPSKHKMTVWRAVLLAIALIGVSLAGWYLIPLGGVWVKVFNPFIVFIVFIGVGYSLFPQQKEKHNG